MMDCSQFRGLLADLDRPGVLPAELRERAFAHAEICSDCGQLLTETESLDSELRRIVTRYGNSKASGRVEAHLLNAFRGRKAAAARESMWRFAAVIGIAAMMLLALGFWLHRRSSSGVGAPISTIAGKAGTVQPKIEASNTRPQDIELSNPKQTAAADGPREGAATSRGQSDVASEGGAAFIPLPDAEDPAALDDGAVVRVVMPRADLASFGLPVEALEGDGTVRADLIVSADGTPQAIRLVSQDDEAGGAAQR